MRSDVVKERRVRERERPSGAEEEPSACGVMLLERGDDEGEQERERPSSAEEEPSACEIVLLKKG
jgi:hypothetical protein